MGLIKRVMVCLVVLDSLFAWFIFDWGSEFCLIRIWG